MSLNHMAASISWVGPMPTDFVSTAALSILSAYLLESGISPLFCEFVLAADAPCSSIWQEVSTSAPQIVTINLESVRVDALKGGTGNIATRVKGELARIYDDMTDDGERLQVRMRALIAKARQSASRALEDKPCDTLSNAIMRRQSCVCMH